MEQDLRNKHSQGKQFRRKFVKIFFNLLAVTLPIWGSLVFLVAALGTLFAFREKISIFNGIYYAFITALTIGYGDITPHTNLGMILSVIIGVLGMVATGIIVAMAFQAVKISYGSIYGKDLTDHKKGN